MAFTKPMLDALEKAIATGAKEVFYGDKKVVYQSREEMMATRKMMYDELNGLNTTAKSRKYASFSKGFNS
jgi:hypothetical protein